MFHLIGDFYLSADKYQFILAKPVQRGAGRVSMNGARYCVTLQEAVTTAANLALREGISSGEITSLQDAVTQMQRISYELKAAVSEMQQ